MLRSDHVRAQPPPHRDIPVPEPSALAFLRWLYPDEPPGWVTLFTLPEGQTAWFRTQELEAAATHAEARALAVDVYVGVGLRARRLQRGRGRAGEIVALPGLFADIDIQHPVHRAADLPPTWAQARALLDVLPPPSLIVDSGHGMQPWWLFKEVWVFDDASERRVAAELLRRFQATVLGLAARQGWHLDATHDLARLLRLPGTWNRKREPVPVTVVEAYPDRRYASHDFAPYLAEDPPAHGPTLAHQAAPARTRSLPNPASREEASNIILLASSRSTRRQHGEHPSLESMSLDAEAVGTLYRRPDVATACARHLGLPTDPVGQSFCCILPGHAESRPSASLYYDPKSGTLKYRDWHQRDGDAWQWFTLPEVYASLVAGHALWLPGPSTLVWELRLLCEAGVLVPVSVPAPTLPPDAPARVRRLYEGFLRLLAVKWLHTPHAPTAFSWRFAADWCGMGQRQVGAAMSWLLQNGYVRQVGTHRAGKRTMAVFLPGLWSG